MEAMAWVLRRFRQGRRLQGAITDRDIVVRGGATGASPVDMLVRDCMTSDIAYAFEDEEVDAVS